MRGRTVRPARRGDSAACRKVWQGKVASDEGFYQGSRRQGWRGEKVLGDDGGGGALFIARFCMNDDLAL